MNKATLNPHAVIFGFISVFLTGLGLTIVTPLLPFMVAPYASTSHQATVVTLLAAAYAAALFVAAPVLGALSDRFGRKPVLLLSLVGAAVGYVIFGIGGSLWLLFIGRIIDGLTGGEIAALFAYFADITPPQQRTRYFGWISAVVGIGTALGPLIGGFLAGFGNSVPFFVGAAISLLNAVYGFFFMPETLDPAKRSFAIRLSHLNPFSQLHGLFLLPNVKRLLLAGFLLWLPNGSLQAIFSQLSLDSFSWQPAVIGLMFAMIGIMDILVQTFVMPSLLRVLNDKQITRLGMLSEINGYLLLLLSIPGKSPLFYSVGMILFSFGDAVFGPAYNGLLSKSANQAQQGQLLGGAQSIQALARVAGPLLGGQLYLFSHATPALMGILGIGTALFVLKTVVPPKVSTK